MKPPTRVSSRTKLAEALGISRPTLYAFARLPDSPPARDGYWRVADWRKFVTRKKDSVKLASTEKEQLEMELLRKRIHRVDLEIADLDNSREEEIANRITGECKQVVDVLVGKFRNMPRELSGIFSALEGPMAIYKRFDAEVRGRFQDAHDELQRVKKTSRRKDNIIPLRVNGSNGNGSSIVLNGARAAGRRA